MRKNFVTGLFCRKKRDTPDACGAERFQVIPIGFFESLDFFPDAKSEEQRVNSHALRPDFELSAKTISPFPYNYRFGYQPESGLPRR